MSKLKLFATAAGTVTCALAIGYFMQRGEQSPARTASLVPTPVQRAELTPAAETVVTGETPLALEDIAFTSADANPLLPHFMTLAAPDVLQPDDTVLNVAFDPDAPLAAPADPVMPHLGCDVVVGARPAPGATVSLTIDAPCDGNERVSIHHTGMMFSMTTSSEGRLAVDIPALSDMAVFVVEFASGRGGVAMTEVPDLADYDRVALQWTGDNGFEIHAREFGADYQDKGHVWSGSDADMLDPDGGVVLRLGDDKTFNPMLAEVYSFPAASTTRSGIVALTVEAEVTEANCGRDIAAQSIELKGEGRIRTQDLVLSMPDCTGVGDFLVLNNLVDDLKIAAK